jgi:hypothetical protein
MINAKVKIIESAIESAFDFEEKFNAFLKTIDVRQIIKTEFSTSQGEYSRVFKTVVIYYLELEDIREAKIDNILSEK